MTAKPPKLKVRSHVVAKDRWVGEAITNARIAHECWAAVLRDEIKIEPESSSNLLGASYVKLFTEYAKGQILSAVAVLHRGFFEKKTKGRPVMKSEVACRMEQEMAAEKIDEFRQLGQPFRDFRAFDQHRERPEYPPVFAVRMVDGARRPTILTPDQGYIDPFRIYELLKSLEPTIYARLFRNRKKEERCTLWHD